MAYALRYYKELIHEDGSAFRLEIHKKDSTADPIEIGSVIQGLSLEIQGAQGDVDSPIVKTSLSMTFVDASDIDDGQKNGFWQEFYTPDALLWRVKLKAQKANTTGFYTIWEGYVTPDSFSENLVYHGSVNIIARDNIGHMQDFPFDAVGDADGMISLRNLVEAAWEKASVQMNLVWNEAQMMVCDGVPAYNTLMNISQFEEKNWYKAVESALASYGMVMRYIGDNKVQISSLRYMPNQGAEIIDNLPKIEPVFIAGAQRELVPAVRRIEESVDYDIVPYECKPVKDSDFTGEVDSFYVEGDSVNRKGIAWPIKNIQSGSGWCNPEYSLFFNAEAYEFWNDRDNDKSYMWLAANNYEISTSFVRYAEFSTYVKSEANISFDAKFGNPYYINIYDKLCDDNDTIIRFLVVVKVIHDGHVYFLQSNGEWGSVAEKLTIEAPGGSLSIPIVLSGFDGTPMVCVQIHQILTAASERSVARYVPLYSAQISSRSAIREKNSVNTIYNAENNVILSRNPEIGPAFDNVVFPNIIKNGIFYRSGDMVLPARLWAWSGSTPQQMAVYNHLQLICYYATPNNLISGTIVNADLTRGSAIYWWHGKEHLLVSGRYNFLNRHIESAVLRGFVRYDDMWGEISGAALPDTEQKSTNDVENNASSRGSSSTYTNSTTINIGSSGGGGASYLNDLMDVNVEAATAQSVLFYTGNEWVPRSLSVLLGGYASKASTLAGYGITDAYTKTEVDGEIAGINSAIAKKADADNVYTIAQIDTKVFTINNALADRYTKGDIDGKITTINGVLTSHDNRIKSLEDMWYLENGVVKSKYPMMSKGYAAGATATADGGGGGIINKESIISALQYTPVNPADLGALAYLDGLSYSDVGVTKDVVTSLIGPATYAPYNVSGYLPLTGGTISVDTIYQLAIKRNGTGGALVAYENTNGTLGFLGVGSDGQPMFADTTGVGNTLYHTGNFNPADYLPLIGGTINGTLSVSSEYHFAITNNATGNWSGVRFRIAGENKGYLGIDSAGKPIYVPSDQSAMYTLLHSGNVGGYAAKGLNIQTSSDNTRSLFSVWRGNTDTDGGDGYVMDFNWNSGGYKAQIYVDVDPTHKMALRQCGNSGTWNDWKTIAFTDSDITGYAAGLKHSNGTVGAIVREDGNIALSKSLVLNNTTKILGLNNLTVLGVDSNNVIDIGYGTSSEGADTYISGNNIYLQYSKSHAKGVILNSSGRVTIGKSDLATTIPECKFYVDGKIVGKNEINLFQSNSKIRLTHYVAGGVGRVYTYDENHGACDTYIGHSNADAIVVKGNSNVLIGTNQDNGAKLQVNGGISIASGYTLKIGDATISYVNGVLKVDKPFMAKGYAAGATASVSSGEGGVVLNKDSVIEALGYTPYDSANPNGYITTSALSGYQLSSGLGSLAYKSSLVASDIPDLSGTYLPLSGGTMNENATIHWGANNTEDYTAFQSGFRLLQYNTAASQYRGGIHVGTYYGWQMTRTNQVNVLQFRGYDRDNAQWSNWKTIAFTSDLDNYLPLSGGTISGNLVITGALDANKGVTISNSRLLMKAYIRFNQYNEDKEYLLGMTDAGGTLKWYDGSKWNSIAFTDSDIKGSARSLKAADGNTFALIDSSGHVVIGNEKAQAGYNTHIDGNFVTLRYGTSNTIGLLLNNNGNITIGGGNLAGTTHKLYVDGGIRFAPRTIWGQSFDGTGNVDGNIGITSANGYIDLANGKVKGNATLTIGVSGTFYARIQTSHYSTGYTCPLTINPDGGSVLIGKTTEDSSGAKLQVNGKVSIGTDLILNGRTAMYTNSASSNLVFGSNGATSYWRGGTHIFQSGASNATAMTILSSGNVGIGTPDPQYKLDVAGTLKATEYCSKFNSIAWVFGGGTLINDDSKFVLTNGDKFRPYIVVNSDPTYIGINTRTPEHTLDVEGTGRFSGAVTMASTLSVSGLLTTTSDVRVGGDVMAGGFLQAYLGVKIADTSLLSDGGVLSINADVTPATDKAYYLGHPTKLWKGIYSDKVQTTEIKIGDATISYENGVLKIDKPLMAKGYAAGATATAN